MENVRPLSERSAAFYDLPANEQAAFELSLESGNPASYDY